MYTSNYNELNYTELEYNSFNYGKLDYNEQDYNTLDYTSLVEDVPECVFVSPFDETKCWLDEKQWSTIKWVGIGLLGLFVVSKAVPLITDIKKSFK